MIPLPDDGRILIIAEIGGNHMGDPARAKEGVAMAVEAGADVVKYQMYDAARLVDGNMPILKHVKATHKTQRERFQSIQLGEETFAELAAEADRLGIAFMATPFYEDAVDFLDPLCPGMKIASGDLTNFPLLDRAVATGKPVLLSTGLSTEDEIDRAVERIPESQRHLMHCVGSYPTPDDQAALATIPYLAARYGCPVGYSDHTIGITAPIAAAALGARSIEKHFLPWPELPAGDAALSVDVAEFRAMVEHVRRIEAMMGSTGTKELQPVEAYYQETLRRSLYAKVDIPADTPIEADWLVPLRPWSPDGASPMDLDTVVGSQSRVPVAAGTMLKREDLG